MPTRPQPVKAIIVARGLTIKHIAEESQCNAPTFRDVLNRRRQSWPALRFRVSTVLALPEAELFDDNLSPNQGNA